jgi:hypothetical protein
MKPKMWLFRKIFMAVKGHLLVVWHAGLQGFGNTVC